MTEEHRPAVAELGRFGSRSRLDGARHTDRNVEPIRQALGKRKPGPIWIQRKIENCAGRSVYAAPNGDAEAAERMPFVGE